MAFLGIDESQFLTFLLVLFRVGSLFVFAPLFSSATIPGTVKSALSLALALALTVLGVAAPVAVPSSTGLLIVLVLQELLLGLLFGFIANLLFVAVQLAGQVVGVNMGLGIVSVMDPQFETQVSVLSQFETILATLLFLAIGGDRMLVGLFASTFASLPPGSLVLSGRGIEVLVVLSGEVFRVGLQLSAAVLVALFGANVILGIFARSVPQMNMLILGFPLKIFVGFAVLALSVPYLGRFLVRAFADLFDVLAALPGILR